MSNSNLMQNANSLMAKNEAKIDTKVEFSWVSDVHQQNQTKFKLGYYFKKKMNIVTTAQTSKRILPHLLNVFWFEVLGFLSVFDIINLFISSKRFKGLILNSSSHYKHVFESMNHVCGEKFWDRVLSFNFSIVSNRVKDLDNLEIFLYLKFIFYSFVFSNISLYSLFSHFCFCKRTCDQKNSSECHCQFCSRIYPQIFDNHDHIDFIDPKKLRFSTVPTLVLLRRQLNFLNLS